MDGIKSSLKASELLEQRQAGLFGLGAVLCWSTVATAFKLSLAHFSPAQLLLFSSLVSWCFLCAVLIYQGRLRSAMRGLIRQSRYSLMMGAINPFLYYLVLFGAYDRLPAQEAQAINYTWALTLSLLAVPLLKQKLHWRELMAALICYVGVVVIATRGQPASLEFASASGVGLALLSTLLWALYWILGTKDRREPVAALFMNFTAGVPLVAIYCLVTGELSELNLAGLPGAAYVGVFEMGLSFILWLKAMKLTRSTARIANLIFISPLLSLVLIATILGEPILPSTLLGLGFILAGLALQRLARRA